VILYLDLRCFFKVKINSSNVRNKFRLTHNGSTVNSTSLLARDLSSLNHLFLGSSCYFWNDEQISY
jgi:hypothetical protein